MVLTKEIIHEIIAITRQAGSTIMEVYKTDFSLFLDTANVWGVDYNSTLNETNKIRSAVGLSANMYTAIGPLTFTIAQDLTKAASDKTETFNFRLGTSF